MSRLFPREMLEGNWLERHAQRDVEAEQAQVAVFRERAAGALPDLAFQRRAAEQPLAAAALSTADPTVTPLVATTVIDVLDAVAAATLSAAAVLSPPAARAVLAALWVYEPPD